MINIEWDNEKNENLKKERNICFEDIEKAILEDKIIEVTPHFNQSKYPNQEILVIIINNYAYYVPFVQDEKKLFLKTIIPSRKLNKIHNLKDKK